MIGARLLALGAILSSSAAVVGGASPAGPWSPPPPAPTPMPDLAPTEVRLDDANRLLVTFENQGDAEVPAGVGGLSIFIDGRPLGGYRLDDLADASFRAPGGSVTIPTNFRLAGRLRRVGVVVDPGDEVAESNEHHNTLTRTLQPPALAGPDPVLEDLSLDAESRLRIDVRNAGTEPTPAGLTLTFRAIVDETVTADWSEDMGGLAPGGERVVRPEPEITIDGTREVRVLFNAPTFGDDLDSTNGMREETLPRPSTFAYFWLLAHPKLRRNIVWAGGGAPRAYPDWTASERADLTAALRSLENGHDPGLERPPVLDENGRVSAEDAWTIYIAHVAHGLWLERHGRVPWRLVDMSDEELALLLDSRELINPIADSAGGFAYNAVRHGTLTVWSPWISYRFMRNLRLLGADQAETLLALASWMRAHLVHTWAGLERAEIYGYGGKPPADRVLYPLQGQRHYTIGCWGTSPLFAAVLRGVNIPVRVADVYLPGYHRRPEFPGLDRTMGHADNVHNTRLTPSGNPVPIDGIFVSRAEFERRYVRPPVDCIGSTCNTPEEQAGFNQILDVLNLAVSVLADGLLYTYAHEGPAALDEDLQGLEADGTLRYVRPYFGASARATILSRVEAELTRLGDGDLAAGEAIVTERYRRFAANRTR